MLGEVRVGCFPPPSSRHVSTARKRMTCVCITNSHCLGDRYQFTKDPSLSRRSGILVMLITSHIDVNETELKIRKGFVHFITHRLMFE